MDDTDRTNDQPDDSQISTDEETIRRWAERHSAVPVEHTATDEETERFRLIPEENVGEPHEPVEWGTFFDVFEEYEYVVIYHGEEGAEPFEVVERDDAIARSDVNREEFEERLLEGETVTSTITETTVVESVVVEETTVESELVGSEVIDQRVVDIELVDRECTNCALIDEPDVEYRDWFDVDRYLDTLTGAANETGQAETDVITAGGIPYQPELDVEETWAITRELVERHTIESHIEDSEITETDTIEEHDIDVGGLHQTIIESGVLDVDHSTDEIMTDYDIESEIARDDRIRTHFDRERVVRDEIVDRKHLRADVTGGELLERETIRTEDVETEFAGASETDATEPGVTDAEEAEPAVTESEGAQAVTDTEGVGAEGAESEGTETSEPGETATPVRLTDDEIGKRVVDARGERVGMVTDVEEDTATMYVDPHPSITDRIQAMLDWGDVDEEDLPIQVDQIERITDDRIELKQSEELE